MNRYPDFIGDWQGGGVDGGPYLDNVVNDYPVISGFSPIDGVPSNHCSGNFSNWNAAASGAYNSKWKGVIDFYMVPHARQLYAVRVDAEWDGNWSCGSPFVNGSESDPTIPASTWVAAMRQVIGVLRQELPKVKIEVDGPTDAAQVAYYPGDDMVDLIGHDFYFLPTYDGRDSHADWARHLPLLYYLSDFAKSHGKPLYFGEWCDGYTDGYIITQFAQWMASNNVAGQMYWDSNSAVPDSCQLEDHPARQQAYKNAFANTQYNGSFFTLKLLPSKNPF
jgi:hypothetical protein